jgi:lysyl-tRNA synthetase class II
MPGRRGNARAANYRFPPIVRMSNTFIEPDNASLELLKDIDIGDIIGASGRLFRTRSGEPTIEVKSFTMLAKSLEPLPEKWHGLQDLETRIRQRYVDLIVNPEVRSTFVRRSQVVRAIRASSTLAAIWRSRTLNVTSSSMKPFAACFACLS